MHSLYTQLPDLQQDIRLHDTRNTGPYRYEMRPRKGIGPSRPLHRYRTRMALEQKVLERRIFRTRRTRRTDTGISATRHERGKEEVAQEVDNS